jgi:hypothetical protein
MRPLPADENTACITVRITAPHALLGLTEHTAPAATALVCPAVLAIGCTWQQTAPAATHRERRPRTPSVDLVQVAGGNFVTRSRAPGCAQIRNTTKSPSISTARRPTGLLAIGLAQALPGRRSGRRSIQPVVRTVNDGHGVAFGAGSSHGAPSHVMATWGVVLATGFVTIMAAVLPMLVESKADKARRAEEKAERRRDEKKAAFAAYLLAANELTDSSVDQDSGGELAARGHAAAQRLVNAAMAAELVSTGPELRQQLGATVGLVGTPFGATSGFGEHLETIRALMAAELADDQKIVKEHAGRHAARTGFLDRRTQRTDPSALRPQNQALPW